MLEADELLDAKPGVKGIAIVSATFIGISASILIVFTAVDAQKYGLSTMDKQMVEDFTSGRTIKQINT